ncbi:MAG: alginate lyase family protein [Niabella sp.]
MEKKYLYTLGLFFCLIFSAQAQQHPNILITKEKIAALREGIAQYPLLNASYREVVQQADAALAEPVNVPVPKDGGGGVTHEQHKKNYTSIYNCGIAYQVSGDKKYVDYVRDILLNYAAQYEKWPLHPAKKDQEPGRIFWQSLNDFVWQVYTIQGYDMVYDALTANDRQQIETHLFKPILHFFTVDCKKTLDWIHNHGTWCLAAVGMSGYVLNQPEYVQMALKGSRKDGKTGYIKQLDELFSPDGYYAEGPYYQRYAMLPFIILAKTINNYQPELKIFDYRDKILSKAINTTLQTAYTNGFFFPVNDAIKDKSFESPEIVLGVNIAYADIAAEPGLLDVAQQQQKVTVSDAGLAVSKAVAEGKTQPFKYISAWFKDGAKGDQGGLGVLRYGANEDQQCMVLKAASQGMGHGHFDRLNMLYYDHNTEMFFDYGASRFINIESKGGGGYLKENNTWAKQTIAHNTLVADRTSHFNGKLKDAELTAPQITGFKHTPAVQYLYAKENKAYNGINLSRLAGLVTIPGLDKPLLVDIFQAQSVKEHQYDLPFWYKGHIVATSFPIKANTTELRPLGTNNGYQHIWNIAETQLKENTGFVSILNNYRFYTTYFIHDAPVKINLVRTGANDPDMNLTEANAFIQSAEGKGVTSFINLTETHGKVDPVSETVTSAKPSITNLAIQKDSDTKFRLTFLAKGKPHQLNIDLDAKDNIITVQ